MFIGTELHRSEMSSRPKWLRMQSKGCAGLTCTSLGLSQKCYKGTFASTWELGWSAQGGVLASPCWNSALGPVSLCHTVQVSWRVWKEGMGRAKERCFSAGGGWAVGGPMGRQWDSGGRSRIWHLTQCYPCFQTARGSPGLSGSALLLQIRAAPLGLLWLSMGRAIPLAQGWAASHP